jgi:tRNA dimethylallyltransferase
MPSRSEEVTAIASSLIAIVGPTGVGKTRYAVALCQEVKGEIVSADSRQIFKGLDIGTDKPTPEQRSMVSHHLVDAVAPDEQFTLAQYQERAYEVIEDVLRRGRIPVLVGGTGLYVRAVLEGFEIPRVVPDTELRGQLMEEARTEGPSALHARLAQVDPEAARRIDPRNVRRVIRALEVYETTRKPITTLQERSALPYMVLKIGLTMERKLLYRRVDERVDSMVERGLVAEVEGLLARGYGEDLPAMSGLGYRQILKHLRGELGLPEAIQMIKSETHRLVRQQYKWFRLDDESIHWFDVSSEPQERIEALTRAFLANPGGAPSCA